LRRGYTYGDNAVAAERLDLVGRASEPTTRSFLARDGVRGPAHALDLGCGQGNTTRLLAETLVPVHTMGLDASGAFLQRAKRSPPPGVTFHEHDVRDVPLSGTPADLIFTRLLLSHLPDPTAMVARWGSQLREAGLLMLNEMEDITAEAPNSHPVSASIARGQLEWIGLSDPCRDGLLNSSHRRIRFRIVRSRPTIRGDEAPPIQPTELSDPLPRRPSRDGRSPYVHADRG